MDDRRQRIEEGECLASRSIADRIGASREMVSRVMKDLEERGFVQTQGDGSMLVKERLLSLT